MLKLYHTYRSTCSRKVRLCLAVKRLECELQTVNLGAFEQHGPDYLAINPNGVVPALLHDGRVVIESTVINEYLDAVFPDVPLRPDDPYALAQMRVWTKFVDDVCLPAVVVPTWNASVPAAQAMDADAKQAMLARIPTPERRERWARMTEGGFTDREFQEAHDKMRMAVTRMEATLSRQPWLAGDSLTLADLNILPYVNRFREIDAGLIVPQDTPHILAWFDALCAMPGVRDVLTQVA